MRKRRWYVVGVFSVYLLSLGWGYLRLPSVAFKTIGRSQLHYPGQALAFHGNLGVSSIQDSYLRSATKNFISKRPEGFVPFAPPKVTASVKVKWNALALARVETTCSTGSSLELQDNLYLCLFGAWIPVHRYKQMFACGGPPPPPKISAIDQSDK